MKKAICLVLTFVLLLTLCGCHKYRGDVSEVKTRKVEINDKVKKTLINEYSNTEYCPFIVYNDNIYYSYLKNGKSVDEAWRPLSEAKNKENAYFEILDTADFGETTVYTFENKSLTMFLTDKTAVEEKLYVDVNYNEFPDYREDEIEEIKFVNMQSKSDSKTISFSKEAQIAAVLKDIIAASQKNICNQKGTAIPENASKVYEVQIIFKQFGAAYIYGFVFNVDGLWKISSNEVVPETAINMSKESQVLLNANK